MEIDDRELLSNYVATASGEAFAELVRRNADMVYSSALRQLNGDEHLAQDVTQAVFFLLARKAKTVRRTVPGFLLWTTHYACRDARKLAVRRAYHERRAGAMRLDAPTEETPDWETYAPALDAALMRLPGKDRDAVALRYFRGMNLKDVGQTLGISEEAARKRVSRATDRLRALMRQSTTVPAASILAQHLALHATVPAPSSMVASIASGTIQSGTLPAAIASKAAAAIALAKFKFAAILLLAFTLAAAAGGGVFALVQMNSPANSPTPSPPLSSSAPAPAAPMPQIPELNIPGQIQLVRWEAVLDDAGAKAMNDLLTPLNTDSKVFRAATANGAKLRDLVASLRTQGNVINLPNILAFAIQEPDGSLFLPFETANFLNNPDSVVINPKLDHLGSFTRKDQNHLHFDLNYRDFKMPAMLLTGGASVNPNILSHVSMVAHTDLTAGDAIAFLADIAVDGKNYHRFIVWETFKATPRQIPFFRQESVSWWCAHGPAPLRTWADEALRWQSKTTHPASVVAPEFQKKLSDGKIVRLTALDNGAAGPFCWWDARGDPVVGPTDQISLVGYPTNALFGAIEVSGNAGENSLADPLSGQNSSTGGEAFDQTYTMGLSQPVARVDVGILVGPWIDCGDLPLNKTVSITGTNFRVEPQPQRGNAFYANLTMTGGRDFADFITAISRHGQEAGPENLQLAQMLAINRASLPRTASMTGEYRLLLDDVKTFHLYRRKREWVRFGHFALLPKPMPGQ